MTNPSAPTSPLAERRTETALGVNETVAQAFRSAAHAFQVQAAGLFRGGRMVAFASPGGVLTLDDVGPAVTASTDVAARGSITRFFSPPGSDTDYVLYATPVQGDLALVAFFSMETPLGNARRTGQAISQAIVRAGVRAPQAETEATPEPAPAIPRDWIPEQPPADLARSLLGEEPAEPPPPPIELPRDWVPSGPASETRFPFLEPPPVAPPPPPPLAPAPPAAPRTEIVVVPAPAASGPPLVFSMILLPRFPEHRLTGALVGRLQRWVHRLCLAWDWTPVHLAILPDRLALTLSLGADVAPAQALHQIRDGLAMRVLHEFPELAHDLPSGRFWATPFLLLPGSLPDPDVQHEFIQETRRGQGFSSRN